MKISISPASLSLALGLGRWRSSQPIAFDYGMYVALHYPLLDMVLKWTKARRDCSLACIFSSGGHHFPVQWHLSTYSLPSRSLIRDGSWTMPPSNNCDKVGRWSSRAKHGKGGEGKSRIGAAKEGEKNDGTKGE